MKSFFAKLTIGRVLAASVVIGFSVLLLGGYAMYRSRAPIPRETRADDGTVLFTAAEIQGGQAVYQKYGLMDWGSVLGHGTYYGPDFTAETLHRRVEHLRDEAARARGAASFAALSEDARAAVESSVQREVRTNRYDAASGVLSVSRGEAQAFRAIEDQLRTRFTRGEPDRALPPNLIREEHLPKERSWVASSDQIHQVSAFFWWTSWIAAAEREPGTASYTNNWPFDAAAGNTIPASATLWSGVSVALLVLVLAVIVFAWHRGRFVMDDAYPKGAFPKTKLSLIPVHASQRKTIKYFVVAGLLFLVQSLLGGYLAHYYVEGGGFYGLELGALLPFTVAKTWHLQLAIFWIATAWLGLGLYVAPAIGGGDPKHQGLLVDVLFGAVVLVAVGSLAGEYLGVTGKLGNLWWLFGHSGWELIELGYVWKILLAVGFALWLFLVVRAVRGAVREEKKTERVGLLQLFLLSAIAIPAMFGAAFMITPGSHLTMADYWRWWVIHLWVEGMFEVFAVVALGLLMVNMGLVTKSSATRALKFQLAILLGSGIIGIGHHYYWIGAGPLWIALGSVFSALEVVPLTLLAIEAYDQWRVMKEGGREYPYRHVFGFLMAVAFWNLLGAGVFGFLINLPNVAYFEHGSFLTANHGHGATMGVFGMLAIALALYCVRNLVTEKGWSDRLFRIGFWGLNVGLFGMCVITLFPVGVLQLLHAQEHGFWSARSLDFYREPLVHTLLWLRMLPDAVFIALGVLPIVSGLVLAARHVRPVEPAPVAGRRSVDEPGEPELAPAQPELVLRDSAS